MNIFKSSKKLSLVLSAVTLSLLAASTSAMAMEGDDQDKPKNPQLVIVLKGAPAAVAKEEKPAENIETKVYGEGDFISSKRIKSQVTFPNGTIHVVTDTNPATYQLISKGVKPDADTEVVRVKYKGKLEQGGMSFGILLGRDKKTEKWTKQLVHDQLGDFEGELELTSAVDFKTFGIGTDGSRENELCFVFSNYLPGPGTSVFTIDEMYCEIIRKANSPASQNPAVEPSRVQPQLQTQEVNLDRAAYKLERALNKPRDEERVRRNVSRATDDVLAFLSSLNNGNGDSKK